MAYENDEIAETPLSIFIADNKADLVREFVKDNQELYEEFMKLFGEDTHDNIKEGFAEYHYNLFGDYCQDVFDEVIGWEQTKYSLMRHR